jgi:hypothetical protein
LEDERSCHLIDHAAMLLSRVARFVEDLVGLMRCKTFVMQMYSESGKLAEFGCKCLCFGGLGTLFTGKAQRNTYDDGGNPIFARQAAERANVISLVALAFQGHDGLGSKAKFVRNCYTDSSIPDIQTEEAGGPVGGGWRAHDPSLMATGRLGVPGWGGIRVTNTQLGTYSIQSKIESPLGA